ncbi:hypothetical protein ES703_118086 [subsurface metagenome]
MADNIVDLFFDLLTDIIRHIDMGTFRHSDVHLQAVRIATGKKHNPWHPDTQKNKRQEEKNDNPADDGVGAFPSKEKSQNFAVSILHSGKDITLEFGDQKTYYKLGQKIEHDSECQQIGRKHLSCRIKYNSQENSRRYHDNVLRGEFQARFLFFFTGGSLHERDGKNWIDHVSNQHGSHKRNDNSVRYKGHEFSGNSGHKYKGKEGSHSGQCARENGYCYFSDSTSDSSGDGEIRGCGEMAVGVFHDHDRVIHHNS